MINNDCLCLLIQKISPCFEREFQWNLEFSKIAKCTISTYSTKGTVIRKQAIGFHTSYCKNFWNLWGCWHGRILRLQYYTSLHASIFLGYLKLGWECEYKLFLFSWRFFELHTNFKTSKSENKFFLFYFYFCSNLIIIAIISSVLF